MMTEASPGQEPDMRTVRIKLAQRIVELKEALVVGSRKVKLQWEVRNPENNFGALPAPCNLAGIYW